MNTDSEKRSHKAAECYRPSWAWSGSSMKRNSNRTSVSFFLHKAFPRRPLLGKIIIKVALCALATGLWTFLGSQVISEAATVTVQVAADTPVFIPDAVTIHPGDTVNWIWAIGGFGHSVTSGSNGTPDGLFDSGVHEGPGFTFSFTFRNQGTFYYYCQIHWSEGHIGVVHVVDSAPPPSPTPAQLLNVSTRTQVLGGDQVLIGGFIISGSEPKEVVLRAIGPSLAAFEIPNPLLDPVLELHGSDGSLIVTNDNWKDTQKDVIEATTLQPENDLESAILSTLQPGNYTMVVNGKGGGIGVALVEAYDLNRAADSKLANISTRGLVEADTNVMIGGFILGGESGITNVVIRALGPSLSQFGIVDALADPILELHDSDGSLIGENDNWKETQQRDIEATGLQPQNDLESVMLKTLAPGTYTAIIMGKSGATGVALVEVYGL